MEWLKSRFELSRAGGGNIRPMEGLRGFAVFLVFLVHYTTLIAPWVSTKQTATSAVAEVLHSMGNAGVDLFFVLSGYLIYGSLITRSQPFGRFMRRRVQRIYPAFVAVFLIYVALSFVFVGENKIPPHPLQGSVYLLENFLLLPGLVPIEPMITVAWSLSYEMFYYLLIPLVIGIFVLRAREPAQRMLFFAALAAIGAAYCAFYGGPVRLIMFLSGILLFEALESRSLRTPGNFLALAALAVGLITRGFESAIGAEVGFTGGTIVAAVLFVSFFLLCATCFRSPNRWLPRAFSWTPLRWLGNMSYSYYLLHALSLKAAFLVLAAALAAGDQGPVFFWALMPLMFALTLIPTTSLFLLVERPFSLVSSGARSRAGARATYSPAGRNALESDAHTP